MPHPSFIDLKRFIRAGDRVLIAQGTGEPRALTSALVDQRAELGGVEVFLGASFTETFRPEHADHLSFRGLGGFGTNRRLARAGVLDIVPCHLSALPGLIANGAIDIDVVLVQVAPPQHTERYNLGVVVDYLPEALTRARIAIAEVDKGAPRTHGATDVSGSRFAALIEGDRGPTCVPAGRIGPAERAIGEHVADLVPDGAVLQFGIGAAPDAVAASLLGKRDLGLHTGMMSDRVADLITSGAVNNARKKIDRGVSVAAMLVGTSRLYDLADGNPAIRVMPTRYTHAQAVLARHKRFIAVNSAVEVDLSGQVNAETAGGVHVGAVGGAVDFMRGAAAAEHGRSIVALPSTAKNGTVSRIVGRIADGVVSTARSDIDLVVTEHGAAELEGQSVAERARRLIRIAAPQFRDELRHAARSI